MSFYRSQFNRGLCNHFSLLPFIVIVRGDKTDHTGHMNNLLLSNLPNLFPVGIHILCINNNNTVQTLAVKENVYSYSSG